MRKRKRQSIHPKYTLIICSVICFVFIILSFKFQDGFSSSKTAVGNVVTPMQKGINSIGSYFSGKIDLLTSKQQLLDENQTLKQQLDSINYENRILQQEKYELDNLRNLYKLDQNYPAYPKVGARVISRDGDNWYGIFHIDKGSDDGLAVNMNVLAGNGLVGVITEVGTNFAKVRTILDDRSNVSGTFLKTSDKCFIKGNLQLINQGKINVDTINKDAQISDGFEVVTSQTSSKFLPGILIGYVSDIQLDENGMTKSAKLTPAVDFDKIDNVLVITQLKELTGLEDAKIND